MLTREGKITAGRWQRQTTTRGGNPLTPDGTTPGLVIGEARERQKEQRAENEPQKRTPEDYTGRMSPQEAFRHYNERRGREDYLPNNRPTQ